MDEVAVVQRLQSKVAELQIALGQECFAQHVEVIVCEVWRQQLEFNTPTDKRLQRLRIVRCHIPLSG